MTLSSVLKTLSVTTVAMTAAVSTIAPAQALSLNGSLTITGVAEFGSPEEAAPLTTTLDFTSNEVETASGNFASLVGLESPDLIISTLNLDLINNLGVDPLGVGSTANVSTYNFTASSNPFIDLGDQDLFGTGLQSLTFNLDSGVALRNYFNDERFNSVNLTEVSGRFVYGGEVLGLGNLSASRSGDGDGYEITLSAEPIPEPFTILGSLSALGVGTVMKKQHDKRQNKA